LIKMQKRMTAAERQRLEWGGQSLNDVFSAQS